MSEPFLSSDYLSFSIYKADIWQTICVICVQNDLLVVIDLEKTGLSPVRTPIEWVIANMWLQTAKVKMESALLTSLVAKG